MIKENGLWNEQFIFNEFHTQTHLTIIYSLIAPVTVKTVVEILRMPNEISLKQKEVEIELFGNFKFLHSQASVIVFNMNESLNSVSDYLLFNVVYPSNSNGKTSFNIELGLIYSKKVSSISEL